jgi:uncharacterized protein (DUF934 family)
MLVKGGRIIDDTFTPVGDGEPLPGGPVIVSLRRFQAEKAALLARGVPLAVKLETADTPEILGDDVHKLAAIVLHIHHFKDGRAFSWARLLRTRLGYRGEVRISGHFLLDQIAFYTRVGADAFDIAQNLSVDSVKAALTEISNVYQPSVDGRRTIRDLRAAGSHKATVAPS